MKIDDGDAMIMIWMTPIAISGIGLSTVADIIRAQTSSGQPPAGGGVRPVVLGSDVVLYPLSIPFPGLACLDSGNARVRSKLAGAAVPGGELPNVLEPSHSEVKHKNGADLKSYVPERDPTR